MFPSCLVLVLQNLIGYVVRQDLRIQLVTASAEVKVVGEKQAGGVSVLPERGSRSEKGNAVLGREPLEFSERPIVEVYRVHSNAVLFTNRWDRRGLGGDLPPVRVGREKKRNAMVLEQSRKIGNWCKRLLHFLIQFRSTIERPYKAIQIPSKRASFHVRLNTPRQRSVLARDPLEGEQHWHCTRGLPE